MWWNSIYIFRAICDSSVLFHDFMQKVPEIKFSTQYPLPLDDKEREEQEEMKAKAEYQKMMDRMMAWKESTNRRYDKEQESQ